MNLALRTAPHLLASIQEASARRSISFLLLSKFHTINLLRISSCVRLSAQQQFVMDQEPPELVDRICSYLPKADLKNVLYLAQVSY
jgi:hypothetical protein